MHCDLEEIVHFKNYKQLKHYVVNGWLQFFEPDTYPMITRTNISVIPLFDDYAKIIAVQIDNDFHIYKLRILGLGREILLTERELDMIVDKRYKRIKIAVNG